MKLGILTLTALSALSLQLPCLAEYDFAAAERRKAQQVADRYAEFIQSKLNDRDITANEAQLIISSINDGLSWADDICSTSDERTCKKAFYDIYQELQRAYTSSLFNDQSQNK